MSFEVAFVRNTDGSCAYTADTDVTQTFTVKKLISGGVFELIETNDIEAGVQYEGLFLSGDGIYRFEAESTIYIISNDCALMSCLKDICKRIMCGEDVCEIALFNSTILLCQVYWGLLANGGFQANYIFNVSTLAGEITTLSSMKDILDKITKNCQSLSEDESDCGCS
jgi:hypothetical protein